MTWLRWRHSIEPDQLYHIWFRPMKALSLNLLHFLESPKNVGLFDLENHLSLLCMVGRTRIFNLGTIWWMKIGKTPSHLKQGMCFQAENSVLAFSFEQQKKSVGTGLTFGGAGLLYSIWFRPVFRVSDKVWGSFRVSLLLLLLLILQHLDCSWRSNIFILFILGFVASFVAHFIVKCSRRIVQLYRLSTSFNHFFYVLLARQIPSETRIPSLSSHLLFAFSASDKFKPTNSLTLRFLNSLTSFQTLVSINQGFSDLDAFVSLFCCCCFAELRSVDSNFIDNFRIFFKMMLLLGSHFGPFGPRVPVGFLGPCIHRGGIGCFHRWSKANLVWITNCSCIPIETFSSGCYQVDWPETLSPNHF